MGRYGADLTSLRPFFTCRYCEHGGLGPTLLKAGEGAQAGAEALFRAVDFDHNGTLSFNEFVSIVVLLAASEQGDTGSMMQVGARGMEWRVDRRWIEVTAGGWREDSPYQACPVVRSCMTHHLPPRVRAWMPAVVVHDG